MIFRKFILSALILLQLFTLLKNNYAVHASSQETVEVDLKKTLGETTRRAGGLLNFLGRSTPRRSLNYPPKNLIDDLKLKSISMSQGGIVKLPFLHSFGVDINFHIIGPFKDKECPKNEHDWSVWEEYVKTLINKIKKTNIPIRWEIISEPNEDGSWHCSDQLFLQYWKRMYKIIRQEMPGVKIVGPSTAEFDINYIERFLTFASENNVLPDLFSWHELYDEGAAKLPGHKNQIENIYAKLHKPIPPFEVNEAMGKKIILRPGMAVQFFAVAEREKLYALARSCWPDVADCFNMTLNGLLTDQDKGNEPRSIYWPYREYGSLSGNLVDLKPSDSVDGLAAVDNSQNILKILLGNHKETTDLQILIKNFTKYKNLLDTSGKAHLKIWLIPDTETQPLTEPVLKINKTMALNQGNLTINFSGFKKYEAAFVYLCPTDDCQKRTPTPTSSKTPLKPGDANGDGFVDGVDYVIWLNHYNLPNITKGAEEGDFNTPPDGKVDGLDYVIWINNLTP